MEIASVFGGLDVAGANSEVTEVLSFFTVLGVVLDDGFENLGGICALHRRSVELAETLTVETATEVEIVFSGGPSNKTDLGNIGAGRNRWGSLSCGW